MSMASSFSHWRPLNVPNGGQTVPAKSLDTFDAAMELANPAVIGESEIAAIAG
jgi:hypothetical protein